MERTTRHRADGLTDEAEERAHVNGTARPNRVTGELGDCPNRQGYLVLGHCTLHPVPMPEACVQTTADCSFGILHCRCLRYGGMYIVSSGTVSVMPRDKKRITVKTICNL